MKPKICYNFLVCKKFHESRTIPLFIYHSKHVLAEDTYYLGGFDSIDNIKITNASSTDDYLSCIEKTFFVFKHRNFEWDWCFIGDDDTFINYANLNLLVSKLCPTSLNIYGCCGPAPTNTDGVISHAHGGSGILFNKEVYFKIKQFLLNTNFSIKHHIHSDVSLALNVHKYNLSNTEKIKFVTVAEMPSPHVDLNEINPNKIVTIHTKDRITFNELESKLK